MFPTGRPCELVKQGNRAGLDTEGRRLLLDSVQYERTRICAQVGTLVALYDAVERAILEPDAWTSVCAQVGALFVLQGILEKAIAKADALIRPTRPA